jgi:tripartite-type tricarboxylate transporter receptor subunit TctC
MNSHKYLLLKCLLVMVSCGALPALAQYPSKPITMIVAYSPGTATDIFARMLAEPLSQALGQPVIVDNKPGADATIGTNMAAKAAADGYTLLLATSQGVAASPAGLTRNVPYDPVKDLSYISLVGTISYVWVVNNSLNAKTPRELIDYIKANPGKLNYGSGNMGGIAYMAFLKRAYGLDITHVPYKSTPPALIDLMAGRIQVMMVDVVSATPYIRSGKVKGLGVASQQRFPLLPDLPTLAESGVQDVPDMSGWYALAAPASVPLEILDRLNKEVVTMLNRPSLRDRILQNGFVPTPSTREQAERYQRVQL